MTWHNVYCHSGLTVSHSEFDLESQFYALAKLGLFFSAEMLNRVQHDDAVGETSPVVEAPEVTLVNQLTFIFEYRPVHCL